MIYLETPLTVDKIKQLKAGDEVFLSERFIQEEMLLIKD